MKNPVIIILFLLAGFSYAQTGIYKNADDFKTGKVTHFGKKTKIKLHETFKRDILEVKFHDSTFSYLKNDVFGYIDKDASSYRFFENEIYPILNPNEQILIYKKTTRSGIKNSVIAESFFFSKTAGSPVLPLTLKNIERAFEEEKVFDEIIEIHFKTDNELSEYDNIHKMYKLNRLFELSKTGKLN